MSNHYHLVVETPEGNLSRGMRHLNGVYTQRFNRRHGRVGHVFQGRYKALLVEPGRSLLGLVNYIHLNPVRAKLVDLSHLKDYALSSYPKYFKMKVAAPLFRRDFLSESNPMWLHWQNMKM